MMGRILSQPYSSVLARFAKSAVLVAFDFDGTLAPIVEDPKCAELPAGTKQLLRALVSRYQVMVISGRMRADVVRRLHGTSIRLVVGNHGAEPWPGNGTVRKRVKVWKAHLERELSSWPQLNIEDKKFSLSVHFRHCREKTKVRDAILRAASSLRKARLIGGKRIVNVVAKDAPDKGVALQAALKRLRCDTAIYVGDDDTDDDVFSLNEPARILTIRVGFDPDSLATYYLRNQSEIDSLLAKLIELRQPRLSRVRRRRIGTLEAGIQ
jgi:trehalose 6-phosphate phosphatase